MNNTGKCGKCDGRGRINAFMHIDGGKCFTCGGAGKVEISNSAPAKTGQIVMTRGKWISVMNESIVSMKNAIAGEYDWSAEESDGYHAPSIFAAKLATCPHADIVARAKAAALRLGFAV